ncbi:MAG: biopolymer transport protein ExbD [Alteromonas naphthalenivorans]|jgi:biopolymer transport protein ExbD
MIDVAFTLLIIFMVTTPMLKKENALQVELPKGNMKEIDESKEQEITVAIDKSGKFSFNDKLVEEKDILDQLKKQVGKKSDRTVFVKADTAVHYGKVLELVDKIKHVSGVRYVALATAKIT